MRTIFLCALLSLAPVAQAAAAEAATPAPTVSGAGATFPAPVYSAWASDYKAASGVSVAYAGVGSGAGIKQIKAAAVDFGGTDKPLGVDDLAASGLMQFPTVLGGVAPVINIPGIHSGDLRLDGPLLADIFAGKVTMWSDPRIKALNPRLTLPDLPITLAVRSDNSGTTFLWTSYLATVSPTWKASIGAGDHVEWPWAMGGKGNGGVAEIMANTMGSIGYVEYAYARQHNLDLVVLKNHAGAFVSPSAAGFANAATHASWSRAQGFAVALIDEPGAKDWPITGATYVLVRKDAAPAVRQAVLSFYDWAFTHGDEAATRLDYVALPKAVKGLVRSSWADDTRVAAK